MQMQLQVEVMYVNEDKTLEGVLPTLNNPPTHTPTQTDTHTHTHTHTHPYMQKYKCLDLLLKLFSEVS